MIIDIDIKIADSDGKLLHRLEKRFDRQEDYGEKLHLNLDIGKSFEDFLSEYCSYSGRFIRDKLIYNYKAFIPDKTIKSFYQDDNRMIGKSTNKVLDESEITYKINIGSNNIFAGRFPFKNIISVSNTDLVIRNDSEECNENDLDSSSALTKAIEKYEASFYQMSQEVEICKNKAGIFIKS